MKNFTAGERRGLIALIALLALIVLGKLMLDGRFSAAERPPERADVMIETSPSNDSMSAQKASESLKFDSLEVKLRPKRKSAKSTSQQNKSSQSLPQRSPLDEPVN